MNLHRLREVGSASVELVVGITALGLLAALIIAGGRVAAAHQAVDAAATDAARSASLARSAGAAQTAARATAVSTLANQGLRCTSTSISVDTSGFSAALGTPASVTARVTCVADLSDLALPGTPGTRTIRATMRSPIDTYRTR